MARFAAKCCLVWIGAGLSLVVSMAGAPAGAGPAPTDTLKDIKYADLARAVTAQRGKVVVVESWAEH
jgi:hypothetical protein